MGSSAVTSGHTPWPGRNPFGQGVTHVRLGAARRARSVPDHSVAYRSALRSSISLPAQHGEPARLPRTVGPGAQQRRLPAAGQRRDDRHLPRLCAIQGSDKITPGDQPGSCWSYRQRPALISRPDTSGPGQAILAPPVSVPALLAHCQPRADPRVCCTLMHAQPRFRPVLCCPGAADHQDPVMTSYLPLTCLAATLARVRVPRPGAAACPRSPCRWSLRMRRGAGRLRRPQAA